MGAKYSKKDLLLNDLMIENAELRKEIQFLRQEIKRLSTEVEKLSNKINSLELTERKHYAEYNHSNN
jgi:archaellum component FlaC